MLGTGAAAGVRRAGGVTLTRVSNFLRRQGNYGRLRKAGVGVARVLATGGHAVASYGLACNGMGDYQLLQVRRAAAGIIGGSSAGKDPNMVLIAESAKVGWAVDLAFAVHVEAIGAWADALWHDRLPVKLLNYSVAKAKRALLAAKRPWGVVRGPAGAMTASAARLGWTVVDATTAVTELGRQVHFVRDSPKMVKSLVKQSVDRWRWRLAESQFPALQAAEGRGPVWSPIARLLKYGRWAAQGEGGKGRRREDVLTVTRGEQAMLKSAIVGGQWPQDRLYKAGLADHPHCMLCYARGVEVRGTLLHRCTECEMVEERYGHKRPGWIKEGADEMRSVLEERRWNGGAWRGAQQEDEESSG